MSGGSPAGRSATSTVAAGTVQGLQQGDHNTQVNLWRERASRPAPSRLHFHVPRVTGCFAARDPELEAIDRRWPGPGAGPPAVQVVTGLPGVGKSQVAAAYLATRAGACDLVAWLRGGEVVTDLADLAAQMRLCEPEDTVEQRAELARTALAARETPWLLVFDDVDDPAVLERWCPASGRGRVLVTARDRSWAPAFGPELHLSVFDVAPATAFLLARSGRPLSERPAAQALAEALGRLPLALSHAGAYCAVESGTGFGDYLDMLEQLPAAEVFDDQREAFYTRTVASTWATSVATAARRAPFAGRVLDMAAYLAPDAIPASLFDVVASGAGGGPVLERKRVRDALAQLRAFSLLGGSGEEVSVHRLLQKVVRDDLSQRADPAAFAQAVAAVSAALPADPGRPQLWPSWQRLAVHAAALARHPPAAATPAVAEHLVRMLQRVVLYLLRGGDRGMRAQLVPRVLDLAVGLLGPEHPDALTAQVDLAHHHWLEGRATTAVDLLQDVVPDMQRLLGPDDPATLAARAKLAVAQRSAGRVEDSIRILEQVVPAAEGHPLMGAEHLETLKARANLAVSYRDAGRAEEGIALLSRVTTDRERVLGPGHLDTLIGRAKLAVAHRSAGRVDTSIELLRAAAEDDQRLLGAEHPETVRAQVDLAVSYRSAGRTREAVDVLESVVAAASATPLLGPDHPATLRARAELAATHRDAGVAGGVEGSRSPA